MSRPTVYVETSVIGYLLGRIHPDPVISGRQAVTRQWWPIAQRENELLVSELVMQECGAGDPVAAAERLEVLRGLRLLRTPKDAHASSKSSLRPSPCRPLSHAMPRTLALLRRVV